MTAEKLAYWFFRLNGCFTFENFIIHPDRNGSQRTDADLIAVQFQHRSELETSPRPMKDHELFGNQSRFINAFLVEAKQGRCALNGPWTDPEKRNLQRVLFAMGLLPHGRVDEAARDLYEQLRYEDDQMTICFVAVGREHAKEKPASSADQLTWGTLLAWTHQRFNDYAGQKADHPQWDNSGRNLFRSATRDFRANPDGFVTHWLQQAGIGLAES